MEKITRLRLNFWLGYLCAAFFIMSCQDLLGKTEMTRIMRDQWLYTPWWLGAVCCLLALWLSHRLERKVQDEQSTTLRAW